MKRWAPAEQARLLELWREGLPTADIAERLGRSAQMVKGYIQWLRAKDTRSVPFRGKGNRHHRRTEALVSPGVGYVATAAVQPAIIYDRYGKPTGQILDPLTRQRRPA